MKTLSALMMAGAVAFAATTAAAQIADPVLKPATPGGSKQVEQKDGNYVALLGISENANNGPFSEAAFLNSILDSDEGRIIGWFFGAPIQGGAWAGNPAPGTEMSFPVDVANTSSTSGNGKLFDSLWVEFTGTSDFNFTRPDQSGGTDVITQAEIAGSVGEQSFPSTDVPVPATLALFGAGLVLLGVTRRRRA